MKIWLVEIWIDLDGEKVPAGNVAFASCELAEQYVKRCAKEDGVSLYRDSHTIYAHYITPETEQMHAMEYIISQMDVIENLD